MPIERVVEHRIVVRVQVGRHVTGPADRCHGERVVDVTVREQHRDGLEPELGEHLVELVDHADARVDDDALRARLGRDDVAVGAERGGRESGDEHG